MLDGMGKSIERKEIKQIIIRYKLDEKKTQLQLMFLKKERRKLRSKTLRQIHIQTTNNRPPRKEEHHDQSLS